MHRKWNSTSGKILSYHGPLHNGCQFMARIQTVMVIHGDRWLVALLRQRNSREPVELRRLPVCDRSHFDKMATLLWISFVISSTTKFNKKVQLFVIRNGNNWKIRLVSWCIISGCFYRPDDADLNVKLIYFFAVYFLLSAIGTKFVIFAVCVCWENCGFFYISFLLGHFEFI